MAAAYAAAEVGVGRAQVALAGGGVRLDWAGETRPGCADDGALVGGTGTEGLPCGWGAGGTAARDAPTPPAVERVTGVGCGVGTLTWSLDADGRGSLADNDASEVETPSADSVAVGRVLVRATPPNSKAVAAAAHARTTRARADRRDNRSDITSPDDYLGNPFRR